MAISSMRSGPPGARTKFLAGLTGAVAAMALAGCGGSASPEIGVNSSTQAPVALTPAPAANDAPAASAAPAPALVAQVSEPELRQAVERYAITKQRQPAQFDFAGIDLNGDGRAEAVVLFAGQDWCQRTGCSLVVFQKEQAGYRPVSHVISVRPPIMIGPESSFGWRDLMVGTGGGPAPIRTVRLGFTGKGYPANALLQPQPVSDMLAKSQQVLADSPAFTAAMAQPPAQPGQQSSAQ
jgi:hypothetical protein